MNHAVEHAHGSGRLFVFVWIWLLGITGVEVLLAYEHLRVALMLGLLMSLSLVKAYPSFPTSCTFVTRSRAWP